MIRSNFVTQRLLNHARWSYQTLHEIYKWSVDCPNGLRFPISRVNEFISKRMFPSASLFQTMFSIQRGVERRSIVSHSIVPLASKE